MNVAHDKLTGLDRERVLATVTPVLRAHHVEGVELLWRTDRNGRVLELTVERPDSRAPGAGITIELCSEISRDLSAALDVADVIPQSYTLQVGSPGLERALYQRDDYRRFAGHCARLKLVEPIDEQRVVHGLLQGLDEEGKVLIDTARGHLTLELESIEAARLVFVWEKPNSLNGARRGASRPPGGRRARRPKRSK